MELEDIRKKYQCDEGRTFAQWKEWVRKNKPSQAETHIVTAVAPNGSKIEKLIGGYTDAQNNAFDLVAHGYKNVKMFKSVNAGPMKLLRNFSAKWHGAFKDSVQEVQDFDATPAYGYQDILNRYMSIMDRKRKTPATSYEKSEIIRAYNLFKQKAGNGTFAKEWLPRYKRHFKRFGITLDSDDSVSTLDEIREKYANDSDDFAQDKLLITSKGFARANEPLKKDTRKGLKPFEVAFIVKGKDGKPFKTMRSKMAASLEEAKRWANQESRKYNGVTKVEVKEFKDEADCVEMLKTKYCIDAYNLGISKKEIDPKAPLKILSVTTKKEPDGISGSVSFTKGNKKVSERFMVYNSGNWDKKPFGSSAYGYSASDREALMNAVRSKLSTMGIKAK